MQITIFNKIKTLKNLADVVDQYGFAYISQWSRYFSKYSLLVKQFSLEAVFVVFCNFVSKRDRQPSVGHVLLNLWELKITKKYYPKY